MTTNQPAHGQLAKHARIVALRQLCDRHGIEPEYPTYATTAWVEEQIAAIKQRVIAQRDTLF